MLPAINNIKFNYLKHACQKFSESSFTSKGFQIFTGVALGALGVFLYSYYKNANPTLKKTNDQPIKLEQLPNPDLVQTIYTPPHPTQDDLTSLSSYQQTISDLKHDPAVMGITFTSDTAGNLIPIYIKYQESRDGVRGRFTAHLLSNHTRIGFAETLHFLASNNYLKDQWIVEPKQYVGYGPNKENVGKVLLEQVTNESGYKNIGVILNKAIHQKFKKECKGRILIEAVRGTHPYHYKMGFRAISSIKNKAYAKYVQNHEIPSKDLGKVPMYLPDRARELWMEEIHNYPIRFPEEL